MNKNLKKVISAVAAIAISVSSFVAVSASDFTDVADTASYAEAVNALASLGIISGYAQEDGSYTFKPEGQITRAEAATMMVAALNKTQEAEDVASTCPFADVMQQASWAAGYVTVGSTYGYINGYPDGSFKPQNNVTYAQLCTMLVQMIDYGEMAVKRGGYPTGYTSIAAATGISKGVSAADTTPLTRAQVAKMIWNAIQTPKLGIDSMSTGTAGDSYKKLDGKDGRDFSTILHDEFNGYVATIKIDKNAKTNSALSTADGEKVEITVKTADWYDDGFEKREVTTKDPIYDTVFVGDTNAADYVTQTGRSVITYNEGKDVRTIRYFVPSKTETTAYDAKLYKDLNLYGIGAQYGEIEFYKTRNTSKYDTVKVDPFANLYVNGVEVTEEQFKSVAEAAVGDITLSKDTADTYWTTISMNAYAVGQVDSVSYKSDKLKIYTDNLPAIEITTDDIEDGTVLLDIYKDGKKADYTAIQEDDIISVAFDITADPIDVRKAIQNSKFYTIYVSDETIVGKVTDTNTNEDQYTINGVEYDCISPKLVSDYNSEYTFYVDYFGRLAATNKISTSINYGIAERIDYTNDRVTIALADGSYKIYDYEKDAIANIEKYFESNGKPKDQSPEGAQQRAIVYEIKNSTGKVRSITSLENNSKYFENNINGQYKAMTSILDSAKVSSATKFINAEDYKGNVSDYSKMSYSNLKDGVEYEGVAYKSDVKSTEYDFVIITQAGTTYTIDTRLAVISKIGQVRIDNEKDDSVYKNELLVNGEEKTIYSEDKIGYKVGDVVLFTVDSDGYIDNLDLVFSGASANWIRNTESDAYDQTDLFGVKPATDLRFSDDWGFSGFGDKADIRLVYGMVYDKDSNGMYFAAAEPIIGGPVLSAIRISDSLKKDGTGTEYMAFASGVNVYSYQIGEKDADLVSVADKGAIYSGITKSNKNADESIVYYNGAPEGKEAAAEVANYAVGLVVNGALVDVVFYEHDDNSNNEPV